MGRILRCILVLVLIGTGLFAMGGPALADTPSANCAFCSFVAQTITISDQVATAGFSVLAKPLGTFVTTLFSLQLVGVAVGLFFPQFGGSSGLKVVARLFGLGFLFSLTLFLLNSNSFFNDFYGPAWDAGAKAATTLIGTGCDTSASPASSGTSGLSAASGPIVCLVGQVSKQTYDGILLATNSLLSTGIIGLIFSTRGIGGIALLIIFSMAFLKFPFALVELIVKAGLMAALAPLVIAGMVFKPTRGLVVKGMQALLSEAAGLAAMGVVFKFSGTILDKAGSLIPGCPAQNMDQLVTWSASQPDAISMVSPGYWFLFGGALLASTLATKANQLVGSLFGIKPGGLGLANAATSSLQSGARAGAEALGGIGSGLVFLAFKQNRQALTKALTAPTRLGFSAGNVLGTKGGAALDAGVGAGLNMLDKMNPFTGSSSQGYGSGFESLGGLAGTMAQAATAKPGGPSGTGGGGGGGAGTMMGAAGGPSAGSNGPRSFKTAFDQAQAAKAAGGAGDRPTAEVGSGSQGGGTPGSATSGSPASNSPGGDGSHALAQMKQDLDRITAERDRFRDKASAAEAKAKSAETKLYTALGIAGVQTAKRIAGGIVGGGS